MRGHSQPADVAAVLLPFLPAAAPPPRRPPLPTANFQLTSAMALRPSVVVPLCDHSTHWLQRRLHRPLRLCRLRVRRRLATAATLESGSTASALRLLVLNTLQVTEGAPLIGTSIHRAHPSPITRCDPPTPLGVWVSLHRGPHAPNLSVGSRPQVESDADAPWTMKPEEAHGDRYRSHVWKGLTPPFLPRIRGAKLVGRHVEVWWDGDGRFYEATVEKFSTHARQWGHDCQVLYRPLALALRVHAIVGCTADGC